MLWVGGSGRRAPPELDLPPSGLLGPSTAHAVPRLVSRIAASLESLRSRVEFSWLRIAAVPILRFL
eukprot:6216956-Alexandrium_andersonii.AAC.1